jgi:subtilisin family serine protease
LGTVDDYIGGVAHNAKIYALKIVAGSADTALESDTIAAWDWCITNKNFNPNPIMVISHSFGGGQYFSSQEAEEDRPAQAAAATRVAEAGITLLAAAGNDGYTDSLAAPAAFSNVISVGAVDDEFDTVMDYSNAASFLDILAPSDFAYTTDIVGAAGYNAGDYDPSFNGTSAACPYAAGAVACLQSYAKAELGAFFTPTEIKGLLVSTGHPVTDTKVDITKPRVDLAAAVDAIGFPGIHVEDGCMLNGQIIYNWDPDRFTWAQMITTSKRTRFSSGITISVRLLSQARGYRARVLMPAAT